MQTMQKDKFDLTKKGSEKLEQAKNSRQALSADIYAEIEGVEEKFSRLTEGNLEEVVEGELDLSKLDQGIEAYNPYKQTIADLAAGLNGELEQYVQFAADAQHYQGMEKLMKFVPIWGKTNANRWRDTRLRNQAPQENLKQILEFGEALYREIEEVRGSALDTYERLQSNADVITLKIAEFEPLQAGLKDKLEDMEAKYKQMDDEFKAANASRQAELSAAKNAFHKELSTVRHEFDQAFTVYNQAQQALAANEQSRDAFEQMTRDLGRQATMIQEKVDNVTQIYAAAPQAVRIMMTTKGMENVDATINAGTEANLSLINTAMGAVSDATLNREETDLVSEDFMYGIMSSMKEISDNFTKRYEEVQRKAGRSQDERYRKPAAPQGE